MKTKDKTFEQILHELDEQIKADFVKFRDDLKRLSIQEKMDDVFENPENNINLADELLYEPIDQHVSTGCDYAEKVKETQE